MTEICLPDSNAKLGRRLSTHAAIRLSFSALAIVCSLQAHAEPAQMESAHPQQLVQKVPPGIILVPGFFNSLAAGYARQSSAALAKLHLPVTATSASAAASAASFVALAQAQKALEKAPYFSLSTVETLEKTGSPVAVVNNLDPLGSIETNGALLLKFLQELPTRHPQFQNREWIAIGHSCGGLYALHALTQDPSLPVKTLITVSTPFHGLGFIENLSANVPFFARLATMINLQSLMQLRERDVAQVVARLRPPPSLRIVATGGWQHGCAFRNCHDASSLSWVLSITDALVREISDGIVTWSSMIPDGKTLPFAIEPRPDLAVSLEHWEQVQDYRVFSMIGTKDIDTIQKRQVDFYNTLYRVAQ